MSERLVYSQIEKRDLELRDQLAVERTICANERTFLAYVRTSVGLVVAGASFMHFGTSVFTNTFGWILNGLSLLIFLIGIERYFSTKQKIIAEDKESKDLLNYIYKKVTIVKRFIN